MGPVIYQDKTGETLNAGDHVKIRFKVIEIIKDDNDVEKLAIVPQAKNVDGLPNYTEIPLTFFEESGISITNSEGELLKVLDLEFVVMKHKFAIVDGDGKQTGERDDLIRIRYAASVGEIVETVDGVPGFNYDVAVSPDIVEKITAPAPQTTVPDPQTTVPDPKKDAPKKDAPKT